MTIKSFKANRKIVYAVLHCGVFVVFELTCNTKIKPFIKNLYEKIGIEFFNIQTKYEHCT